MEKKKNKWGVVIIVLIVLLLVAFVFSEMISMFIGGGIEPQGNTALIPINGFITSADSEGFFGENVASSHNIVKKIEKQTKTLK